MKNFNILMLLFFFCSSIIYSQKLNIQMPPQVDINKLNNKIYKQLAKSDCYKDYKELKIVHVFNMIYQGKFEKSDFENYNFLTKIRPLYMEEKPLFSKLGYLSTNGYIYVREDMLVALSSDLEVYCIVNLPRAYLEERQKIYYILDWQTEFVFSIHGTPDNMIFILEKSGKVSILVEKKDGFSLMNMNDFINKYWDNFVKGITTFY